jgi:hypothetical protein
VHDICPIGIPTLIAQSTRKADVSIQAHECLLDVLDSPIISLNYALVLYERMIRVLCGG